MGLSLSKKISMVNCLRTVPDCVLKMGRWEDGKMGGWGIIMISHLNTGHGGAMDNR